MAPIQLQETEHSRYEIRPVGPEDFQHLLRLEREIWSGDAAGVPIGDAISSGPISQIAGQGGALVITYVANAPTDLPQDVPAYTLKDPRRSRIETYSQLQLVGGGIFLLIFLFFFLTAIVISASTPF